jgi:hypothetical protein
LEVLKPSRAINVVLSACFVGDDPDLDRPVGVLVAFFCWLVVVAVFGV